MLDIPFAVAAISIGAGAFIGFLALVAVCALVERWRR